jgi:hypothetical protein
MIVVDDALEEARCADRSRRTKIAGESLRKVASIGWRPIDFQWHNIAAQWPIDAESKGDTCFSLISSRKNAC